MESKNNYIVLEEIWKWPWAAAFNRLFEIKLFVFKYVQNQWSFFGFDQLNLFFGEINLMLWV